MGKANFKLPGQRGIINFLPLVVVAVLLIGFVGYFSVNRLRTRAGVSVLGESNTQLASVETDLEGQLEADSKGLDDVGEIDESVSADVEFMSDPVSETETDSKENETATPGAEMYSQSEVRVKDYKFLGLISVKLSSNSFFLRYLGFLFTE